MANRKNFRTYSIKLGAGTDYNAEVDGDMFAVIDSTSPFTITFDESNKLINQSAGMGGKFAADYQRVTIRSAAAQNIIIVLGFGKYNDARANISASLSAVIEPANLMTNGGDVSVGVAATQLCAADASRKEVIISVPSTESDPIRIGTATVTASSGDIVEPGCKVVLSTETAVYGIRTGSTDITTTVLELSRS